MLETLAFKIAVGLAVALLLAAVAASRRGQWAHGPTIEAAQPLIDDYIKRRRWMEAMVVAKKVIKAAPDDFRGHLALAEVFAAQGKNSKAVDELDVVLRTVPTHARALELRSRLREGA